MHESMRKEHTVSMTISYHILSSLTILCVNNIHFTRKYSYEIKLSIISVYKVEMVLVQMIKVCS